MVSIRESEWENQLKHQIPILPDFQSFMTELPDVLNWLKGKETDELESVSSVAGLDETEVHEEEVTSLVAPGPTTSYMDRIRFAAASRLLVRLGYDGSKRNIEPYALARSSDGNLLLQSIRHQDGESRSYRLDRIESVQVLEQTFTPRYKIEITSAGYLPVHQLTRAGASPSSRRTSVGPTRSASRHTPRSGPTYIYRCGVCQKEFRKKSMDYHIKIHQDILARGEQGFICGPSNKLQMIAKIVTVTNWVHLCSLIVFATYRSSRSTTLVDAYLLRGTL